MKNLVDLILERCWPGYTPVEGKRPYSKGSCKKAKGKEVKEGFISAASKPTPKPKPEKPNTLKTSATLSAPKTKPMVPKGN